MQYGLIHKYLLSRAVKGLIRFVRTQRVKQDYWIHTSMFTIWYIQGQLNFVYKAHTKSRKPLIQLSTPIKKQKRNSKHVCLLHMKIPHLTNQLYICVKLLFQ